MENPLINIITRTSGRPNAFKRCVDSVKNQTYRNINHIIITDDETNVSYINDNGYDNCVIVDRERLIYSDESINPHTGPYSPHNLYFNEIKHLINDGWIIYLDDDDLFLNNESLFEIVNNIRTVDEDTIIYYRMIYGNGNVLPLIIDDDNPPKIYGIGGSCFTFNVKYLKDVVWDGWKCADFRVINHLHKIIPKYKWVSKEFILVPSAGFGNKKDV